MPRQLDPNQRAAQVPARTDEGWITVNPLEAAKRPRQRQPDPPSAEEAARIVSAAWKQDADWATFVWLTFITGARRGELLGLVWEHVNLSSGLLTIRRNLVRQNGKTIIKDTKTHQMRIVNLDPDTVPILTATSSAPNNSAWCPGRRSPTTPLCSPTPPTTGDTATRMPSPTGTRR